MTELEDKVNRWDHEYLQEQVWDLENTVREQQETIKQIELELTLLKRDFELVKNEGCWRYVEDPKHEHKS